MAAVPTFVNPSQFLEDARPFAGENKFIVGTFERGITFYRQQIRALNLIYALIEAKDSTDAPKIEPGSRIAIIGGGAFGVTAAAAAAYAGFQVILLERQQALLHLQRGCDTRWLHPRFYDWPDPESESLLARLPMLDWPASTGAQVAAEVERQFMDLVREAGNLNCFLEVSEHTISSTQNGLFEVRYRIRTGRDISPCEVVIYAVGFGNEKGENEAYWRNDRLGQTELDFTGGKQIRYVVSGMGDGGLIDAFRLSIRDFRHERIFSEMFGPPDSPLLEKLRRLPASAAEESGWLYDQFKAIEATESEAMTKAMTLLKERQRSDTDVTLNGTEGSLRLALTLQRVSLSNALLLYCLFRIGAIAYEAGTLDASDAKHPKLIDPTGGPPPWLRDVRLVIRHGTDREKALRDIGFTDAAIDFVKKQKEIRDSGQPIFPAGWWGRYTAPAAAATSSGRAPVPVDFVPPALVTHATTFVSTLGNILEYLIDRKATDGTGQREFRVALHRLTRLNGREVFQQITPYFGRVKNKAGFGRCFPVEGGIIGLASRTGSLVVARKSDPAAFNRIWELTALAEAGAKPIEPYVDSIFACPFFAPGGTNEAYHVSLVLFVDSAEADFFDDEVLGPISAACRGFVQLLETLHTSGALRPVPTFYPGYRVQLGPDLERLISELKDLGVNFEGPGDDGWKEGLSFTTLRSLDLEVGRSVKFA